MRGAIANIGKVAEVLFRRLREWCGDTAYEKYCSAAKRNKVPLLATREQFYVEQLKRRYSRPSRCC
jgi:uncharacterized short protein YbdD (DUF466 family)